MISKVFTQGLPLLSIFLVNNDLKFCLVGLEQLRTYVCSYQNSLVGTPLGFLLTIRLQ